MIFGIIPKFWMSDKKARGRMDYGFVELDFEYLISSFQID